MLARLAVPTSILVRHLGAYTELIAHDVAAAGRDLERRLWVGLTLAAASMLAVVTVCAGVLALTWETAMRGWALAGLLGVFLCIVAVALRELRQCRRRARASTSHTALEWEKDRLLLLELLTRSANDGGGAA